MARLDDAARHDAAASAAGAAAVAGDSSHARTDSAEGAVTRPGGDGGHTGTPKVDRSACQVEADHNTADHNEAQRHAAEPGDRHNATEPTEAAATEPAPAAGGCEPDGSDCDVSEPGWGVSYGFDRDVELPGDAAIAEQAGAEPGWGAAGGAGESREVGPFFDACDQAAAAIDALQELVADRSVPVADLAAATVRLHQLTCRVQAAHLAALGQTVAANALPEGSPTANAWLGVSHRMDSSRASKARNDAAWLAEHPKVAEALAAGVISVDHVTVMRTISQANKIRRAAFADFEPAAVEAATMTDPAGLRQIMNLWATMVDPDSTDDDADNTYERRHLFVTHLGDRWIIKGELPDDMGARLAGTLNAYMDQLREAYTNSDGVRVPASARRADALDALIATVITQATAAAADNAPDAGSTSDSTDDTSITDAQLTLDDAGSTSGDDTDDAGSTIGDDASPTTTADTDDTDDTDDDDAAGDPSDPSPSDTSDPSPSDPSDPFGPNGPSDPNGLGGSGGSGAVITLPPTALTRAQVVVTVPITTLHTCAHCRNHNNPAANLTHILTSHTPTLSSDARDTINAALATGATWAVGNGPGTGTLAPAMLRYATCDGEITRLIVTPASRPLDLGRTRRVVPLSLRRALEIRDRGCIIPGCDRPAGWCHAHHITHWADGGETDLSNLALICQHHHTELHLGHWHIDMNNGTPKATHIPPHQRTRYRRNQRTAQSNRPATTPRRT